MQFTSYLSFDGQCEAAFKFYEQCFGGKIVAMFPFGDTPAAAHVPADFRNKIMHARLVVGDQVLMGSDCTPEHPYVGIKGCSVSIGVTDPKEAERIYQALADKGQVTMPLQQTFWALRFGMVTDRFGVPWMVNCEAKAS